MFSLVVRNFLLLLILLLTGSNNLLNSALICHIPVFLSKTQKTRNSLQTRAFRGNSRRNKTMIKILFICHGNICRSPMSEYLLKDLVEKQNLTSHFEIASAATSSEEIWNGTGNPIYPPAQAELRKHGIGKTAYTNFSKKRARQVTKEDYGYYDYLLCADANNIKNTIRITGPDVDGKIKLLLDFATDPKRKGKSISDPWYSGRFDETYRDVVSGCEGLLAYLKETGQI